MNKWTEQANANSIFFTAVEVSKWLVEVEYKYSDEKK